MIQQQQPVQVYQVLGLAMANNSQPPVSSLIPSWMPQQQQQTAYYPFAFMQQAQQQQTLPSLSSMALTLSQEPPKAPSDKSTASSPSAELPFLRLPALSTSTSTTTSASTSPISSSSSVKPTSLSFLLNPSTQAPSPTATSPALSAEFRLPPVNTSLAQLDILSSVACGAQKTQ